MLTRRQQEVLGYIKGYYEKKNYAPSLEEIRKRFKLASVSTAHFHVTKLEDGGYVTRKENQPRAISIARTERMVKVSLLGTIAAGEPIEALSEKEMIAVPQRKLPRIGDVFALRVVGDSMVDEGIVEGDIVLVKQQSTAENGQKVVALLDRENATVKKFYKERGSIRLEPANKNYKSIVVKNEKELSIQGVLLDVIKTRDTDQLKTSFIISAKEDIRQRGKTSNYLNKVYNGDVMDVLRDLPDNSVDMVFGDPDYNVGIKYGQKNYKKKFAEYIDWYIELVRESMRVLKENGNLFMMNYPKQNAHLRVKYLDLEFSHINEYVWVYNTNVGHTPRRFTRAHRSILHVRKSPKNKFFKDAVALPYKNPTDKRIRKNLANGSKGRMPYSWFEFNLVKNVSKEKTYHACQIPQKLTEMLVKASTKPKDIVFVLFGGSGAEIDVCRNLKRQFISAEIDREYCNIIKKRLATGSIAPEHKLMKKRRVIAR